ncbi:CPBP family intramembrane glutamic endopeptidase, partial [uncultured Treponema sp.]|uniref:CPBP family intramembrane glutamic endopeptidase n=1 Tax=uncultured Treponema sp. TaxID=162155 RepID=UPI0025FAB381
GALCLSSVFFEGIAVAFKIEGGIQKAVFPSSFYGFINLFFGVLFSAFSEEVVYRFYLPQAFKEVLSKKISNNLKLWVLSELISLLLFSLGHIYLGFLGFLNALVCGFFLRFCMIKTKSIWIPFAIHAVYNFLSLLMLFALS